MGTYLKQKEKENLKCYFTKSPNALHSLHYTAIVSVLEVSRNFIMRFIHTSYIIILVFSVSVGLCPCPTWDILNERLHHHAAYIVLKSFAWWVAQTPFRAYTTCGSREKAFRSFLPVMDWIPCTHHYTSSYPEQDESCPLQEALGTFSKDTRRRTRPPHHQYHSCYCFLCEWVIDTPSERATNIFQSINSCLNSTRSWLPNKRPTHLWTSYD